MAKKKMALAGRAWNLLRLALFWAPKRGIFKRGFMADILRNHLKSLRDSAHDSIPYGEREFSFDETPMFNFKVPRSASTRFPYLPQIPCINPSFDFDDFNHEDGNNDDCNFNCTRDADDDDCEDRCCSGHELNEGEEGIDAKAEEFIARFYQQMKLQRNASYLQYNEMLQRSTS